MRIGRFAVMLLATATLGCIQLAAQTANQGSSLIRPDPAVPPGTIATINGHPIGIDDLDPRLADAIDHLEDAERAERKRALEEAVSLELFALDGRPRRMSANDVAGAEVRLRLSQPTPVEIRKVYQDHLAEFGGAPLATVSPQIVAYLREEQTQSILAALAQRLRAKYSVTFPTDINAPGLGADSVLALIGGKPMLAGPLLEQLKPAIFEIRSRAYTAVRQNLDQLLYSRLVLEEARRRKVEPETIIRAEITERVAPVSEAEVAKYFADNQTYFTENKLTLEAARDAIVEQLQEMGRNQLEDELTARLRKQHAVVEYLVEPEAPVLAISVDDDPSRGDLNAPVTVVMFTDFQCPACAKTHPILQELLRPYGNRVRFVVRDFPLEMHPDSRKAAEAAAAANAQGKFFEYIELLYHNQQALGIAQLKQYATQIGLNRAKFDLALAQGTYAREIQHDVEQGGTYGIHSTPAIFINGRRVSDIGAVSLQHALDAAFAAAGSPAAAK